jgi:drug/metabolite transporter (DMT)-like permease
MNHGNPSHVIRALAIAAVLLNVGGNYFLSVGMRHIGAMVTFSLVAFLPVFANLWILLGVFLLACWLIAQLSLLSWADLTYVLPITSSAYVLTALLGAFSLREHVSLVHWIGISLIFIGVLVVGRTRPRTAPAIEHRGGEGFTP